MDITEVFITQEISVANQTMGSAISEHRALENIIAEIKSDKHKNITTQIRKEPRKNKRTEIKRANLPLFYPCAFLPEKKTLEDNSYFHSTGIIQLDIDDLSRDEAIKLKATLSNIPELLYVFISPSNGLKFGIATDFHSDRTDTLKGEYKHAYEIAKQYILSQVDEIKLDDSVGHINCGCYFSYDPDSYLNSSPAILEVAEQAKIKRIEQETVENTDRLHIQQDYGDVSKDEALKALSLIPTNFGYSERLTVNLSVISIFGHEAEAILLNHWNHNDKTKLQNDIRSQIRGYNTTGINAGKLFQVAKKHGYSTTHRNHKSTDTIRPPTFNSSIISLSEAKQKLREIIEIFLQDKKNTLINYEAGGGKTKAVIEAIVSMLIKYPQIKIALFVPSHKLAEEIKNKIKEELRKNKESARNLEKMKIGNSVYVQHIKGREASNCNHPIKTEIDTTTNEKDKVILTKVFTENPAQFCLTCPWNTGCQYIEQFDNILANIRIYTHNSLFHSPSFWDSGSILVENNQKPRNTKWIPDFIIVDEDIISSGILSDSLIEKTTYAKANRLLKNIINDLKDYSLEIVTEKYSDKIIGASEQQHAKKNEWIKSKHISATGKFSEIVNNYKKLQDNKPKYYKVIDALSDYAIALKNKEESVELRNYAIFTDSDNTALYYAPRQDIHKRYKDIPTLLLDASADKDIVESAFSKPFNVESIRVEYQEKIKVTQFENTTFSKKQIMDEEHLLDKVKKYIKLNADEKSFGLITYKTIDGNQNFSEDLAKELGADEYGYFGGIRGINSFSHCDSLFILGRQLIPPYMLQVKFRQLYGGICFTNYTPEFEQVPTYKIFRMADGMHKEIKSFEYADMRMVGLNNHFNRAESYQSAHRLRLIHGDKIKNLYILSNDVLDITVNELVNSDDKFGRTHSKTITKYQVIADGIYQSKVVQNTPKLLSIASNIDKVAINYLKKKDDFAKNIIQCNDKIQLFKYTGTDNNNRTVTKQFYVVQESEPTIKDLGFTKITTKLLLL